MTVSNPKSLVEEIYDTYAKGYDSNRDFVKPTYSTFRYRNGFDGLLTWHFIMKYLPKDPSTHILDAGAGTGYWDKKLVKLGYTNLTLSDLSQEMLNEARKNIEPFKNSDMVHYLKADITEMPGLKDDSFDFIFSQFDPVSYCMKPQKAIKELTRIVQKGGYVIICVDTKFRRVSELIEARMIKEAHHLLKTNISHDWTHPQINFTWQELNALYEVAGLEVVEIVGAPVFMNRVSSLVLNGKKVAEPNTWEGGLKSINIEMEFAYCTDRSLINLAGHIQIIGKKK
ncbi:MAG: class I SAM-dependent methyltransferase [Promethearchaeota archaeon]